MAYMGRGGFSSFSGGLDGRQENNNSDNYRQNIRRYYRGIFISMPYYIPLDNSYVILQMMLQLLFLW